VFVLSGINFNLDIPVLIVIEFIDKNSGLLIYKLRFILY